MKEAEDVAAGQEENGKAKQEDYGCSEGKREGGWWGGNRCGEQGQAETEIHRGEP